MADETEVRAVTVTAVDLQSAQQEVARLRAVNDAAFAFCAAYTANQGAEPSDWSRRAADLDGALYGLLKACGYESNE